MSGVITREVAPDDNGLRLDRWFKKHYPGLRHGRLQKLLRTGQVRLDGGRAKAGARLSAGQSVRIPPIDEAAEQPSPDRGPARQTPANKALAADLVERVVYMDDAILAIDKPAGLAVQGGSKTRVHLDGMLDALRFGAKERPRLVHRLDKDTSGVLLLARTAEAARWLTRSFRDRTTRKLYWAVTAGVPKIRSGLIDMPLKKSPGRKGEKMMASEMGKSAETVYRVLDRAGRKSALLALEPLTGRTHQIRAHAALALEPPIIGDGKYGGGAAFPDGVPEGGQLQLHARALRLAPPSGKDILIEAPVPASMRQVCEFFGFHSDLEITSFLEE